MVRRERWLLIVLSAIMLCSVALTVSAQGASSGTLAVGSPLSAQIAAGATLNYDLILTQPSQVSLQALSDKGQPTLVILSNGTAIAKEPNSAGGLTASLNTLLDAGSYVVQVGTANNTSGLVILVLQSETPVTTTALVLATTTNGVVNPTAPLALYSFAALTDPSFLYVHSGSPDGGINVRLINTTTGNVSGQFGADLVGARFRIPAGAAAYQVEVQDGGTGSPHMFTVCLAAVNSGGCEAAGSGTTPQTQPTVVPPAATPEATSVGCTVMGAVAGGVNIRQSSSTASILVGTLPDGAVANVIGISPDGKFYNVLYNGSNGWIALSVVKSSGDCSTILTINPPPVVAAPTQAPAQPPTQPPAPAASGPCLITIQSPLKIYTTTNAIEDNLFDQVQSGYQLIPVGRTADNSWWQTNYFGSWIQTSTFNNGAHVSGDCSALPIVSP